MITSGIKEMGFRGVEAELIPSKHILPLCNVSARTVEWTRYTQPYAGAHKSFSWGDVVFNIARARQAN